MKGAIKVVDSGLFVEKINVFVPYNIGIKTGKMTIFDDVEYVVSQIEQFTNHKVTIMSNTKDRKNARRIKVSRRLVAELVREGNKKEPDLNKIEQLKSELEKTNANIR